MSYIIPKLPLSIDVETKVILKQAIESNRWLAELKGVVKSMTNASILINTLALQEAKDSSAIESIITTHDELYKAEIFSQQFASAGAKEVRTYADALKTNAVQIMKSKGVVNFRTV